MNSFEKIYKVVSLIPKGKILTYKIISNICGLNNPRIVGFAMHANKDIIKVPCHRVVGSNGKLTGYARGGITKKRAILKKEGVFFEKNGKASLKRSLFVFPKLLLLYFELLFKFDSPGKWPWFGQDKPHTKDEIIIGSILTQNTNWRNVQKAIGNLRNKKVNTIEDIYKLGLKDIELLKQLIRPSGFYNQKGERLFTLCKFITQNYINLDKFSKLSDEMARIKLLKLKGIGKETADTMLLYAMSKPIFIIDTYTKRFTNHFKLTKHDDYDNLQAFFVKSLPKNETLYQDFHALIVKWGKLLL